MPHLLSDVMILNNDCIHDMQSGSNAPERLIDAFHRLEHALRMLRNDASAAELEFKAQQLGGIQQEPSGSRCPDRPNPSRHSALMPSGQRRSVLSDTDEPDSNPGTTDVFYLYDRPLLFDITNESDHDENDTMNFVCATVLFNLSLICHLYAMTARERSRCDLLPVGRKLYNVLIQLLGDMATKNEVSPSMPTNAIVESDDAQFRKVNDVTLLLTLTYHCLGHLYFELGLLAESGECMMRLQYVFMSQNDCFESNRLSNFNDIFDEIKLNILFWKLFVPSPIAIAA